MAETASGASSQEPRPSRFSTRDLIVWGLLVLGMLALGVLGLWRSIQLEVRRPPLPVIAQLPDFSLTDRDGGPFGLAELRGGPWIADFIFTRCAALCPRMTEQMKQVDARLGEGSPVRLVSITVDPAHDTPEVLDAYAQSHGAGADWHFLTGERDELYRLSIEGFKLGVDDSPPEGAATPEEPILHSTRFVLVDGQGRIRGYYDGFEPSEVERLLGDVRSLLASQG